MDTEPTRSRSEFGVRSLSQFHENHPYVFHAGGQEYRVSYLPAESNTGMFGGNSNWRGPIRAVDTRVTVVSSNGLSSGAAR
jgi:hypothetical protein